jgi:hypothetical protein
MIDNLLSELFGSSARLGWDRHGEEYPAEPDGLLLLRAFKGRSELTQEIRYHVVKFIGALRRDDTYGAAVYHQEATELLDRYARLPAQRRFLRQVASGRAGRRYCAGGRH